ncbi:hypothetical protein CISIN_1g027567mg [Citrus sinensis]|uniref:DUF7953 domain-containing protein n=1 Tax=Citrus sinensis TaxID=2711 RepID=A0A067DXC3_CITSI|nr:hypothetical protein CISIN_1g027567mg [Citrus sinensis]
MSLRCRRLSSRVSCVFLALCMFLNSLPGLVLAAVVTLDSIKIYKTHEWLDNKPTVYFKCQGENKKILPDVKEKNTTYVFKGEESWQIMMGNIFEKQRRNSMLLFCVPSASLEELVSLLLFEFSKFSSRSLYWIYICM